MNQVFMIGNLTRDPELTETSGGVAICRFSIAVNRNYTGSDGERKTDFFNCIAWRGLGERVARYVKKGNKVAVSGAIETRNYEDSTGAKRTAYDIVCDNVEFLTPRSQGDNNSGYTPDEPRENRPSESRPSRQPKLQPFDDDGDIPF